MTTNHPPIRVTIDNDSTLPGVVSVNIKRPIPSVVYDCGGRSKRLLDSGLWVVEVEIDLLVNGGCIEQRTYPNLTEPQVRLEPLGDLVESGKILRDFVASKGEYEYRFFSVVCTGRSPINFNETLASRRFDCPTKKATFYFDVLPTESGSAVFTKVSQNE